MRAQLADALTQIAQEYGGKPFMVVGDYNAAASSGDRGTGKLLPYDTAPDALTVVLMRLSLTDVYRHKFPHPKDYTWSNSVGQKSRIDAVYANDIVLDKAGGDQKCDVSDRQNPGTPRNRPFPHIHPILIPDSYSQRRVASDCLFPTTGSAVTVGARRDGSTSIPRPPAPLVTRRAPDGAVHEQAHICTSTD